MTNIASLSRESIEAEFTVLEALATQLKAKSGSIAQRRKDATLTALGSDVTFGADDDVSAAQDLVDLLSFLGQTGDEQVSFNLGDLATAAASFCEWAHAVGEEARDAVLKSQGNDEDLVAMREQFDEKVTDCKALVTVGKMMGIDVRGLEVPTLRAPRTTSTASGASKHGHFYRVVDGVRKDQSGSQDTLSRYAWYHGASLMGVEKGSANQGKGMPTNDVEAFIRTFTDSPIGKSWSHTSPDGVTHNFEVLASGESTSEEE
jgi:hypothetical protein